MGTKHTIKNRNDIENEKNIRFSTKDRQYMVIILVVAELILDRYQIFFYPQIIKLFKKLVFFKDFLGYMYFYLKHIQKNDYLMRSMSLRCLRKANKWEANVMILAMMFRFEDIFFKGVFSYFNQMKKSEIDGNYVINELRKLYDTYVNKELIMMPYTIQNQELTLEENEMIHMGFILDGKIDDDDEKIKGEIDDGEKINGEIDDDDEKINGEIDDDDEKINGEIDDDDEKIYGEIDDDDEKIYGEIDDDILNFCNDFSITSMDEDFGLYL